MKTIKEALIDYPEIEKGYNELTTNVNYLTWLQTNVSPSFIIQYYYQAKDRTDLFDRFYAIGVRLGRLSQECAILKCGIERLMVKSTAFWRINVGDKFKDGVGYNFTDEQLNSFNNTTTIKNEDLLKHFLPEELNEFISKGDLTEVLIEKFGEPFLLLLESIDNTPNMDTFIGELAKFKTNVIRGFQLLSNVEKQYLMDHYTPEVLNDCFLAGVNAYSDGILKSKGSFAHINSAQLAWGIINKDGNWCGENIKI